MCDIFRLFLGKSHRFFFNFVLLLCDQPEVIWFFLLFYFLLFWEKVSYFSWQKSCVAWQKHLKFIAYVNVISHELCGCVVMFMPSVMKRWYLILIRIFLLLNWFSSYSIIIQSRTYWIFNFCSKDKLKCLITI